MDSTITLDGTTTIILFSWLVWMSLMLLLALGLLLCQYRDLNKIRDMLREIIASLDH